MHFSITVLPGDGIGPEVTRQTIRVLEAIGAKFGHTFNFLSGDIGGCSIDKNGTPLPQATLNMCKNSDAVLLGAVGGPKWDDPTAKMRPEDGLLAIRKEMGVFANLRPVKVHPVLAGSSPIKEEIVNNVDIIIVRELTGGLYFGRPKRRWENSRGRQAIDTLRYTEPEIERILRVGFELAKRRSKHLTSVDKANVLASSQLWREIAIEIAPEYPDVTLEHMLVDTASMVLIRNPSQFDVIVTENTFGDILTDEASVLAGSMGMLPSASLSGIPKRHGKRSNGLYEPIHGSAPDIVNKGIANPIASILSAAMLVRYSLALEEEAKTIEKAVDNVLYDGHRTADVAISEQSYVGTDKMADLIIKKIITK